VNRTLVQLLQSKNNDLRDRGISWRITGVASRTMGWIANENGLDINELSSRPPVPHNVRQWLKAARADVLFEATSLSLKDGQLPSITFVPHWNPERTPSLRTKVPSCMLMTN
jgi:homoserine dehydrogenase